MYVLCYVYGWLVYVTVSAVKQYTVAGEGGPGPGGGSGNKTCLDWRS